MCCRHWLKDFGGGEGWVIGNGCLPLIKYKENRRRLSRPSHVLTKYESSQDDHSSYYDYYDIGHSFITVPPLYYSQFNVMFLDCVQADKCWMKTSLVSRFISIFCDDTHAGSLSCLLLLVLETQCVYCTNISPHIACALAVCCHMGIICVAWWRNVRLCGFCLLV